MRLDPEDLLPAVGHCLSKQVKTTASTSRATALQESLPGRSFIFFQPKATQTIYFLRWPIAPGNAMVDESSEEKKKSLIPIEEEALHR